MKMSRLLTGLAVPALLALSACATPFSAKVARFQMMPPPAGQSFVIQPMDPHDRGGLEFAHYAELVRAHLASLGYQPAATPQGANFVVTLGYGVDHGQQRIVTDPGFGYGPWGGFGPYGWGGWGGWGRPFYYGWNDPFLYGGWGSPPTVTSYTVYTSFLDMDITRTADNQRLFEGHARARSGDDDLTRLVPNLVEAMFTGFPGNSGEEVRITVPPPQKAAPR